MEAIKYSNQFFKKKVLKVILALSSTLTSTSALTFYLILALASALTSTSTFNLSL